jgi:hypothetical protein
MALQDYSEIATPRADNSAVPRTKYVLQVLAEDACSTDPSVDQSLCICDIIRCCVVCVDSIFRWVVDLCLTNMHAVI